MGVTRAIVCDKCGKEIRSDENRVRVNVEATFYRPLGNLGSDLEISRVRSTSRSRDIHEECIHRMHPILSSVIESLYELLGRAIPRTPRRAAK